MDITWQLKLKSTLTNGAQHFDIKVHLSDTDLRQLNPERILDLTQSEKDHLLLNILEDLKEARERLQANSKNSSKPPSSDPPWRSTTDTPSEEDSKCDPSQAKATQTNQPPQESSSPHREKASKPAGRQPGAKGYSRAIVLPITDTILHPPSVCTICGKPLDASIFQAETGLYVLELDQNNECHGLLGLIMRHDKHLYGAIECSCGHINHSTPGRCEIDPFWRVSLSEWCLIGPHLSSFLVCLAYQMRISRRLIRELLRDWFGIEISTSLLNRCLHEAGRAVEPLEEQLAAEVREAVLAHMDETPWKEWGLLLWMWVISTPTVCWYLIGSRSAELLETIFDREFLGWIMSDGYQVYRRFNNRLRCWAHLDRKAIFLTTCMNTEAQRFGQIAHDLLKELMDAIYKGRAREEPPIELTPIYAEKLDAFHVLCQQYRDARHEKTRALAREFLKDWEAIFRVLDHVYLPFTNNEAEQALRHWVIVRRITQGTRTPEGTRALGLLASIIATCRKRNHLPWPYIARVIAERRKGHPAPPLPIPIATA